MSYDHWKTTNPADEFLGDSDKECIWCGQRMQSPCTYYEETDNCLAYLDATLARVDAALNEDEE